MFNKESGDHHMEKEYPLRIIEDVPDQGLNGRSMSSGFYGYCTVLNSI